MKRLSLIVIALAALIGCQTVPEEIPADLTQAELIQRAQEAADQENWSTAIAYYNAIIERFPQDRAATATARYEIAFIEYKRGNLDTAESEFLELLGMYDFEDDVLPAWPRVLAQKLLDRIEEEQADARSAADGADAAQPDEATAAE
jgi:outer membrane protein assembly factor BamD (BamD/ComL family)